MPEYNAYNSIRPTLAWRDTVAELTTYVHHLIVRMDSNMGDWYDFSYKLSQEREWMWKGQPESIRFSQVKFHGASCEKFIKSNEAHMPAYNLLLHALPKIGVDMSVWEDMIDDVDQSCPARGSGFKHMDCRIGVSTTDLPRVLKALFKLEGIDEADQGPFIQVADALKAVREKEPELTGWVFLGYPV